MRTIWKKLLHGMAVCGLLAVVAACGHSEESRTTADIDSLIRPHLDKLYSEPARTDSALSVLQRTLTDSAQWLRVDLFRAVVCSVQGDSDACRRKRQAVIDWCDRHPGNEDLAGMAWNHRGVSHYFAGRSDSARWCYERACQLLERSADRRELVSACINLADADLLFGRIADAAAAYRRAHFVADSLGMGRDLMAINSGLASVYLQLENFKEAHHFLDEARKGLDAETEYGQYYFHMTSGNCFFFESRYEEALRSFEKGYRLARRMDNGMMLAHCWANIGETYLRLGNPSAARPYIVSGEAFVAEHPDADPSLLFYLRSLSIELAMAENRMADAGRLLSPALDTAGVSVPRYIALHYDRLRRYAEQRGDWRSAYAYQSQARSLYDSLRSRTMINNFVEINARYARDTTLLHQQVLISGYKIKSVRQHSLIMIVAAGLLVLGLSAVVVIIILRRRNERRYRRQLEQIARLRMDVVRNRLSPHFIFNVLNTVLPKFRAYPELEKPMALLIDVLRDSLPVTGSLLVPFAEEREKVERYVRLFHCSNGARPHVEWRVDECFPADRAMLPAMALQIPVENALKHAFSKLTEESRVRIDVKQEGNGFSICVADNGDGLNATRSAMSDSGTGLGVRVLSRTLELLNEGCPDKATFRIVGLQPPLHGTEIHIYVPYAYGAEASDKGDFPEIGGVNSARAAVVRHFRRLFSRESR